MRVIQTIINFLKSIFMKFSKQGQSETDSEEEKLQECTLEEFEKQMHTRQYRKVKRSLMERLYVLRQEIMVFETVFPNDYATFLSRIETLEKQYETSLQEMKNQLTFSIDPDIDWGKIGEVVQLEKDVKRFIETQVRFVYLSNKFQRLIVKLNILYNVSIFHTKSSEKQKVISQLERVLGNEEKLREEFLQNSGILEERKLSERLFNLLSYTNYLIMKLKIRVQDFWSAPIIWGKMAEMQMEEAHYMEQIKNFIKDEVYDLSEMLHLIGDEECRRILKEKAGKIIVDLTYAESLKELISSEGFWNKFLEFENSMVEMLKASGVDKEEAKVKLIARMDIRVEEDEVLASPMANSYLALTSLFATTHDMRILLLLKILKEMSKEVTYKEIYFLVLLLEALPIIESSQNSLSDILRMYQSKYPYGVEKIRQKKQKVKEMASKEYVAIFCLDEHAKELEDVLEDLNIDFKILKNTVFINSFYFIGLDHVTKSLENKSKYIA